MSNTYNEAPFPKLRSAYLRAIAHAWRDEKYMQQISDASKGPRGALDMLEQEFKFRFPFNVKFCIDITDRPIWDVVGAAGWTGFADDFHLSLPSRPVRAEDRAPVLARYLAEFPSLLGATMGQAEATAPGSFAAFGVVTGEIIARVWEEARFATALFSLPDARSFVQDNLDCVIPWNFRLRFSIVPGENPLSDEYWEDFPRSVITVHLPMQPKLDYEPAALAAYNATGAQYPFSCI